MCYGPDAQPPRHTLHEEVASQSDMVLTSPDGTRFSARLARPARPNGAGIVVMPDVRGLYSYALFSQELTEAGVTHRAHTYDGAPHSFFDRSYDHWQEACTDSWSRILDFMEIPAA